LLIFAIAFRFSELQEPVTFILLFLFSSLFSSQAISSSLLDIFLFIDFDFWLYFLSPFIS